MPAIKYFGRRTPSFGRPLWEIVLNLKNFGIGRYVLRSQFAQKYPTQPCYHKILSVHPHFIEYPETFEGNIIVETVFRGVKKLSPEDIGRDAGYADFQLVLKEDEPEFFKRLAEYEKNPRPLTILPRTAPLPPIWREILAQEMKISPEEVPEMPLVHGDIIPGEGEPRRVANEGETPSYRIEPSLVNPKHPEFYQHVVSNRDKAKEAFKFDQTDPDFIYADKSLTPVHLNKSNKA